jgi:hypothetical protein
MSGSEDEQWISFFLELVIAQKIFLSAIPVCFLLLFPYHYHQASV